MGVNGNKSMDFFGYFQTLELSCCEPFRSIAPYVYLEADSVSAVVVLVLLFVAQLDILVIAVLYVLKRNPVDLSYST
jgi:hypothetical protein